MLPNELWQDVEKGRGGVDKGDDLVGSTAISTCSPAAMFSSCLSGTQTNMSMVGCPAYSSVWPNQVSGLFRCLGLFGCPAYSAVWPIHVSSLFKVSGLFRCLDYSDVQPTQVSGLFECLAYWSIRPIGVSGLFGCPAYSGVQLIQVSGIFRSLEPCLTGHPPLPPIHRPQSSFLPSACAKTRAFKND
ncbi:hypothetical protein RRG08_013298 [Elysia crispata]|uniref:Uncharacterized protein n=1 Tax=Elysia crispata TaxID=231223 RepID=A0AAE1AX27_9GAST|nr:hypothetical protein RRG08_013298 [Elysia crispata]